MEETIYVVTFWSESHTEILKAYEDKQDARQRVQKEAQKQNGVWKKVSEDCWTTDEAIHRELFVEEVELVRDLVDPRKETRW